MGFNEPKLVGILDIKFRADVAPCTPKFRADDAVFFNVWGKLFNVEGTPQLLLLLLLDMGAADD